MKQRRTPSGTTLLVCFLAATLALAGWLGVHAATVVSSHRETAEAALRDYARTATWESRRIAHEQLDGFLDELFEEAYYRLRRNRDAPPAVVRGEFTEAVDEQDCACEALRHATTFFAMDLRTGVVEADPDTLGPEAARAFGERLTSTIARRPMRRRGLFFENGEGVAYIVGFDRDRRPVLAVGIRAPAAAWGPLFGGWYATRPLLPPAITGPTPTDSLLRVAVRSLDGAPVLESAAPFMAPLAAVDTLDAGYGSLVIEAGIRPDAAGRLVIGGLPRSNLPLILGLLFLTLGVGVVALVQIRRDRQLAALRDDFISSVSHELRTPLAQIRVFADLEESGKLRSDDERRRAIRVINREAARLSHLVDNVLRFSRPRASALPAREVIDVSTAVREAVEAMRPLAGLRRMDIAAAVEDDLHAVAGRDGMRQILVNLLDNAVKYGPAGQRIRIHAANGDRSVRITVEDEGPGIPPGERERIFQPYRRLARDVEARHPGTGIGLAVVADLASLYGGSVVAAAATGGGARFVVTLRAAPAPAREAAATVPA